MFATDSSSSFLSHLFEVIDLNHDASLSFLEFLRMCATFCCYSEVEMVHFAFETFDTDGSGEIGVRELSEFIGKLESRTGDIPKTVKRVLTMFDRDSDHSIGLDEFAEMNLKYPHLLWPAFRLQYRVQEVTLGLTQWKSAMKRIKERKEREKKAARLGTRTRSSLASLFPCLSPPPPPPPPAHAEPSRSVSRDPSRKLNADRMRRKDSKSHKKLSVMRSRKSGISRSGLSREHSLSGRSRTASARPAPMSRVRSHTQAGEGHSPGGRASRDANVDAGGAAEEPPIDAGAADDAGRREAVGVAGAVDECEQHGGGGGREEGGRGGRRGAEGGCG